MAKFSAPFAVRADLAGGLLYVADTNNYKVRTVAIAGSHAVATLAALPSNVREIALNAAARIMYVAVGNAVYVVTYTGESMLLAGDATGCCFLDGTGGEARFYKITGLALDARRGVLYVADEWNHRIRRISIYGGVVTTLAGSGDIGNWNGVGTGVRFNYPWSVALDPTSSILYIGGYYNNAIRRIQVQTPTVVVLAAVPLPVSPLAPTHQLAAWRALGMAISSSSDASPGLDARNATFLDPLTSTNTAGINPAIRTLLLGVVTLAPRDPTPAAAGNTNTTFSTSAQRGLRSLTLATAAVPAAALALPALTNLTLAAPVPKQPVQLIAGSFTGLAALTCLNGGGIAGLTNLSSLFRVGNLLSQPLTLPLISALDASATGVAAVYANSFDGMLALQWLSLADTNLSYISDVAFSPPNSQHLRHLTRRAHHCSWAIPVRLRHSMALYISQPAGRRTMHVLAAL